MHHCGRIHNAAVVTISESRDVALTHVLNDFQQVGGDVKLARLTSGVGHTQGATRAALGLAAGQVVTTLLFVSGTVGFSFQEFVSEHPIAPATVVVKQSQ